METPSLDGLPPVHPGAILKNIVLPGLGVSKVELARRLKIGRQTLYQLLDGGALTAPMALKLGKLCGNEPAFWMNLQSNYDLARAREALGAELDEIEPLRGAGG